MISVKFKIFTANSVDKSASLFSAIVITFFGHYIIKFQNSQRNPHSVRMKSASSRAKRISHLRSKYFTAKLFHLPEGQISLKKAKSYDLAFFLAGDGGFAAYSSAKGKALCAKLPSSPSGSVCLANRATCPTPRLWRCVSSRLSCPCPSAKKARRMACLALGRGRRTRTHDTQFWRLVFYRLNYTPMCVTLLL